MTLLLVEGFTGSPGDDLDTDDDGLLDVAPWSRLVDSVGVTDGGSSDQNYGSPVLAPGFDGISFSVGGASRIPNGTDTDADSDWTRNDFNGAGIPALDPGTPDPGEALNTPDAENRLVGSEPVDPIVNEFVFNHTGTDDFEYVEIFGDAATDYSAFTVLEIEGDGSGAGTVDGVFPVGTTNAGGFWTTGFLSNALENGTVTLLLVEGFTGAQGDDLDTDDDGLLDVAPWARVVDSIGVTDGGSSDRNYGSTVLTPGFDGVPFTPGGASRLPNGIDTDAASDWTRNDFNGAGIPALDPGTPEAGEALNTPDAENQQAVVAPAGWIVNEIHADPDSSDGDANDDGTANFSQDEFVEILNFTGSDVDVSGWTLADGFNTRHVFPSGTVIRDGCGFVVFGGGSPGPGFGGMVVETASSGALGLNNGGDSITLSTDGGSPVASESYGSEGGNNQSLTRDPDLTGSFVLHTTATGSGGARFSPGTRIDGTRFDGCPEVVIPVLEIFEIQGSGLASPVAGQIVTSEDNVVTGVGPRGFFMQTPAERIDGDAATSDGLFVFTSSAPGVSVGDRVTVTARVVEFFDLTEMTNVISVDVLSSGHPLPAPVALDADTPAPIPMVFPDLEPFEGMVVRVEDGFTSGPSDRFGDLPIVAAGPRAFREPGIEFPGLAGLPVWDGNPEVFEIDPDALGGADPAIDAETPIVVAEGPLTFAFGDYQIAPTQLVLGPAPVLPEPVRTPADGEMTVGSLNLFRLFDDVDDPGPEDNGQVVSTAEYQRRLGKFSAHVRDVLRAPDVLGIQEVESLGVLQDLAARIAFDDPSVSYSAFLVEGNDVGGIDVGFLVRDSVLVDSVVQLGAAETLSVDGSPLHDRPPLVLEGRYVGPLGDRVPFAFTVMVVHNRSLGGIDDPADGPRVRQKRLEQALSIAEKVQAIQTAGPNVRLTVVGDYNAFQFTDGFVDVVGTIAGDFVPSDNLLSGADLVDPNLANQIFTLPDDERYSFIFDGSAQALDHALTSAAFDPWLRGFDYGRGNADAAASRIDTAETPLRSSDHDGLVLFVMTDADGDFIADDRDLCPGSEVPEAVPTVSLGVNRYALVDGDGVFDTNAPPGGGPGDVFTTEDTRGCTCAQIVEILELGRGHETLGCSVGVMQDFVASVA